MEQLLTTYYADNAEKLHRIVKKILLKFGGLSDKDMDDFYSLANEVFVDAMRRYDNSQSFEVFLYTCLFNRIRTEITKRNREKRKTDRESVSIDMPLGDEEEITLKDVIADQFDIEQEILRKQEKGYSKRMMLYLGRLSSLQRTILELDTAGYTPAEIRKKLNISERQYADCNAAIHSYRNVSVLLASSHAMRQAHGFE